MKKLVRTFLKRARLREEFEGNVDFGNENAEVNTNDINNVDLTADKIYSILNGYIVKVSKELANRNEIYYSADRFGTFDKNSFIKDIIGKLKKTVKSKIEDDKITFYGLPKVKNDSGYYSVESFDSDIEMFLDDLKENEAEIIVNLLNGKTFR